MLIILLYIVFALLAAAALFPLRDKRVEKLLLFVFGVILFLLAGFRSGDSMPDYVEYINLYNRKEDDFFIEPSFIFISRFVQFCIGNHQALFIIYAGLAIWLKFKAIKQLSELWFLSVITYFSLIFLIQEMAQMRAGLAMAFMLLAIKPIYERKGWKFLIYATLAIFSHYSAVVVLFLWFINRIKKPKLLLYSIIPIGYVLYFFNMEFILTNIPIPYIQYKFDAYLALQRIAGDDLSVDVFGIGMMLKIVVFYVLLFYNDMLQTKNKYVTMLLIMYGIGIATVPAFASMPALSYRLSALFMGVDMLLYPMLYYVFKQKVIGRLFVVVIALMNFILLVSVVKLFA